MNRTPSNLFSDQTRRAQNKEQTLAALVSAAYDLLRLRGYEGLTVEKIADRAGVSRRTFFNYFPSLADSVTYHVDALLSEAVQFADDVPKDASIKEVVQEALDYIALKDDLERVAYLHYCSKHSADLRATSLLVWERTRRQLIQVVSSRSPGADALTTAVLVESLLGAVYAAFNVWSDQLETEPGPKDTQMLVHYLRTAMNITEHGPLSQALVQPTNLIGSKDQ